MAEEFKAYLDTVDAQIRWKRARPALRRELRTHLEEQKADCMAAGMREADAEAEAVRQMGDAQAVGQALDAVHRPRKQTLLLIPAALLAVLGAVLRVGYEGREATMTLASLALTAAVLVGGYLFDYRWLGRHAWALYGVGLIEWVLLAPMNFYRAGSWPVMSASILRCCFRFCMRLLSMPCGAGRPGWRFRLQRFCRLRCCCIRIHSRWPGWGLAQEQPSFC